MGRFLQIAIGSASELEYQLLLAYDLHYLSEPDYRCLETQVVEVKRMLSSLMRKVRTDS
jgi:four helix bundle protein